MDTKNIPWLKSFDKNKIVTRDTEPVTKINQLGKHSQHVATVSVVNYEKQSVYSAKIFHKTGSFLVNPYCPFLNEFETGDFDIEGCPDEQTVRND